MRETLAGLADGLACPRCRLVLAWRDDRGRCSRCERFVPALGGTLPNFTDAEDASAAAILALPDGAIGRAVRAVQALRAGESPLPEDLAKLQEFRIVDASGALTAMGRAVSYHVAEFRRQAEGGAPARLLELLRENGLGPGSRILDVGGGAGQTLRRMGPVPGGERVCLDLDLTTLAFGRRWASDEGEDVRFVAATAHELPFRDARFSHVICRVGLNYMHQATALAEMVRVLEPGGVLCLTTEGPGFDLGLIARSRGPRELAGRLVDAAYGSLLGLTGRQPAPGGRSHCGRSFSTAGRLRRQLRRLRCDVLRLAATRRRVGLPVGFECLAVRRDGGPPGKA
ncbi:class I SAM-dependent methyltransferase [Paludisphaera soli]|uniref:class I SAM-dependent methyltransferase n=1 Tax=Paludisphaera soli TaxID=2712865 RepID=UPI0013EBE406|nr:class I SAM-dependent methyltransferase [Paludisphaera soli]